MQNSCEGAMKLVYESLLEESESNNIYVIENANFKSQANGFLNGDVIGINRKIHSNRKRACILAEEMGHYHTTIGNILNLSNRNNQKQELKARLWAYDKLIGLTGIVKAYENGCRDIYDMANYLEVTEDFLVDALKQYQSKYGTKAKVGEYEISFVPNLEITKK